MCGGGGYLLCDKTSPGETQYTGLLVPHRKPTTEQSKDTTKTHFGGPVSFSGVTYRNMGRTVYATRNDSKIAVSPKPTLARVTEAGNLEHITQPAGSASD